MSLARLILFAVFLETIYSHSYIKFANCNHYYDKPIDVCFSAHSSPNGLLSYKYSCSVSNSTTDPYSITLNTFNSTDNCDHRRFMNSTILYNLTSDDINGTGPLLNRFVSCRGSKSCPYFRGRYYLTKLLTDAPTPDPTVAPSEEDTSLSTTTADQLMTTTTANNTNTSELYGAIPPLNETCARKQDSDYYQEVVYIIDRCLPYEPDDIGNVSSLMNETTLFNNKNSTNDTVYISNRCVENAFGIPLSITSSFYLNETCNNSRIEESLSTIYSDGECYNYTTQQDAADIESILFDSETDYFKLSILECNYLLDGISYPDEYLFYEFDLIWSWIVWITASLMLVVYTLYILAACRTVKQKQQYKETGILMLDDDFSESRLAVIVFQWFTLFSLWLNSSFGLVNAWSYVEIDEEEHCNLMMSALDLSWHWGKGFLYLSLMSRIVLIMEGLSDEYEIPKKILKLFAFEVVAYFMLTPVLDLVTTRADHRLRFFIDERSDEVLFICGEVIEYWISFLLFFGDLLLCSTTIGVYLYALGELVMNPIENQKLIDMLIRYAIFSIFAAIWIQIGNGLWATNNFCVARYIDNFFIVLSVMFTLTMCTGCYTQCCSGCHKRMRRRYITSFMEFKRKLITKEEKEIKNNPKYVLKSYDKTFDSKLSAILSPSNLAANKSMEKYHKNVAFHHINSNAKSKKKWRKLQKKMKRSMRDLGIERMVKLNDRDLATMEHLVTFKTNEKFIKRETAATPDAGASQLGMRSVEASSTTRGDIDSEIDLHSLKQLGSVGSNRHRDHGLLAHLDPSESTLPTALIIAIHSSVVENANSKKGADDDRISHKVKETIKYKVHQKMDKIWTKVDTYYDEKNMLFCRRSPTIFPGIAYKMSKAERFALKERKDAIEGNEYSKSEEHSDSADSEDDAFESERIWPNASRKYGQAKSLQDIYEMLSEMEEAQLETIWDYIDKKRKKKIDYKATLVKLLGAFFLLYFRKQLYNTSTNNEEYIEIHKQPPRFDELEPLLVVLAKYIRDALRKKKRKCLKKTDYQRNFINKYLRDAIEKRNTTLQHRNTKLQSVSPRLQSSIPAMTPFSSVGVGGDGDDKPSTYHVQLSGASGGARGGGDDDGKIEEMPLTSDELAFLSGDKKSVAKLFNDDKAAAVEIEKRLSNYTPRESANKYGYRDSNDAYVERGLKIDKDMKLLQEKRVSNNMNDMKDGGGGTPESEINVDDILLMDPIATKKAAAIATPTEESSQFDVNALVADLKDRHNQLLTPTAEDIPNTQLSPDGTGSAVSMDMQMIDGLISDLAAIEEDKKETEEEEKEKEKEKEKETQHDTQGTEIINVDVVTPKRNKVMVIDEALIKQETFQIDEDLLNDVMGDIASMHDDEMDDEMMHDIKPQVATIHPPDPHHHDNQASSQDWHVDAQLMDDVLDVTFAVDDSDEDP